MIYNLGDKLISKKPHACGNSEWEIVRTGADYKLKCLSCGRSVIITKDKLEKMIKTLIKKVD